MKVTQYIHSDETNTNTLLIRVPDVEVFPVQTTLSWEVEEPNEEIINELFDRRLLFMGSAKKSFLKLHNFRVLSKIKIGAGKFCVIWMTKIQYLENYLLPELNLAIQENQFLFFHGKLTFWRVGNEWKAKIC